MKQLFLRSFLLLYFSAVISGVNAQKYKSMIIPPSPNASALGKFGEVPVNNYTGLPQINIPIYTIQANDLVLPIELIHHSSAIKIDEMPSWIGMGWSLAAGGVITRSIRGLDDFNVNGFLRSSLQMPSSVGNDCSNNGQDYAGTLESIRTGAFDAEPDMFFFNCNGFSGQFVFRDDGLIVSIPDQKIRIVPPSFDNAGEEWTVLTPDGYRYIFGGSGFTETTTSESSAFTSWYLKKIISPRKNEVTFSYSAPIQVKYAPIFNFFRYEVTPQTIANTPFGTLPPNSTNYIVSSAVQGQQLYLERIDFNGGYVTFESTSISCASGTISGLKKLEKIKVFTSEGTLVREFELKHDFSQNKNLYTDGISSCYSNYNSRIWLHELIEKLSDTEAKRYQFFNEEGYLPPQGTLLQDKWGFYSGENPELTNISSNTTNFSHLNFLGTDTLLSTACKYYNSNGDCVEYFYSVLSGKRKTSFSKDDARVGLLTKIIYPTGGYTVFEYEPNRFVYTDGSNETLPKTGAGFRIKSVTNYTDVNSSTANKKSYSYGKGRAMSSPLLAYQGTTSSTSDFYLRFSHSNVALGSTFGSYVGYDEVTVSSSQSGVNSVYYYHNRPDQMNVFTFKGEGFLPTAPSTSYSHQNGLLKKQIDYGNSRVERVITNTYDFYSKNVRALHVSGEDNTLLLPLAERCGASGYKLLPYFIETSFPALSKSQEDIYDYSQTPAQIISTVKEFRYDNLEHKNPTRVLMKDSDSKLLITKSLYPLDYLTGTSSIHPTINLMKSDDVFMHAYPIEQQVWKGDSENDPNLKLLGGYVNVYKDFDPNANSVKIDLNKTYLFNTETPASGIASLVNNDFFLTNTTMVEEIVLERSVLRGNIIMEKDKSETRTLYQWDSNSLYPIAKIVNGETGKFYFNGFEETAGANATNSRTGTKSFSGQFTIAGNTLTSGPYIKTWWEFNTNNNLWEKKTVTVNHNGTTNIITGSAGLLIDDIRIHTPLALMSTYTYSKLVGLTSETDAAGQTKYYEYDSSGRLDYVLDAHKNVRQKLYYKVKN